MPIEKSEESSDNKEVSKKEENSNPISPEAKEMIEALKKELLAEQKKKSGGSTSDMAELMKTLVDGLQKKPDSEIYGAGNSYVDEANLDPDDMLAESKWVTFFCYSTGYWIVDDKRQGLPVRTPFGAPIIFKHLSTRQQQVGKDTQLFNLAVYVCKSKKELEWLREHSLYGAMFFTKADSKSTPDAKKAAKIVKFIGGMKNYGQFELARMARQQGIDMMPGMQDTRIAIASKLADKEIEREGNITKMALDGAEAAKSLLKSENVS